jgi:hypothetical protein
MIKYTQDYAREVDWPRVLAANKGPYVCWCDSRFPGGYFVTRREPPHVFFCGSRQVMENLAANILAMLGYPIIILPDTETTNFARKALAILRALTLRELRRGISDHTPELAFSDAFLASLTHFITHPRAPDLAFQIPVSEVTITASQYASILKGEVTHQSVLDVSV